MVFNLKKIDQIIREEMDAMHIPGVAIAIVQGTKTVFIQGYGHTNETKKNISVDTPFFIGSSSKSFTAMAIMQLQEKGLISLDDFACKYLSGLKQIQNGEVITIKHLLNHTSGFTTYEGMKVYNQNPHAELSSYCDDCKCFRIHTIPGSTYSYSNLNYVLLGAIIEQLSGEKYADYIQNNIFQPLEMHLSAADFETAIFNGVENGSQPVFGKVRPTSHVFYPAIVPAGYLSMSIEDMSHYLIAQLNHGIYHERSVLSPKGIELLHTKSSITSDAYGLGWFDAAPFLHHGGNCENYHANMMLLPEENIGIAIFYNINDNISGAFIKGTYLAGETIPYDRIQSRIVNSLHDEPLIMPIIQRSTGFHQKLNVILATITIFLLVYGYVCIATNAIPLLVRLIVNGVLPILLLIECPKLFHATWKALLRFATGFAHYLVGVPIYLLIILLFSFL